MYTVNGITYLEGKKHEDKLHGDLPCEVFVDKLDEWFKGKIVYRQDEILQHTTLVFTSFTVIYYVSKELGKDLYTEKNVTITVPNLINDKIGVLNQIHEIESIETKLQQDLLCIQENKVKSDRIRLIMTTELTETIKKLENKAMANIKNGNGNAIGNNKVVKHRSMLDTPIPEEVEVVGNQIAKSSSSWQTVSVTVVDETAIESHIIDEPEEYSKQYKSNNKKQEVQVFKLTICNDL